MKMKKEVFIMLLIQITEVLGFSLVLPFLPLYGQKLGASPFVIGLILTSFSFSQFIAAPIIGRLSDRYGRRPLLIISQTSTFVSFVILALADSLPLVFLSRLIDGFIGSNATVAQAYLSDISSKKDRTKVFSISGMAFGIGFLIGPAAGGFLAGFGYAVPCLFAAFITLITILTTFLFLPETVKQKRSGRIKMNWRQIFRVKSFINYFVNASTKYDLLKFFIYIFSHALWTSNFSLFAHKHLSFSVAKIGFFLTYIGFFTIIMRGIVLPKLLNKLSENNLEKIGFAAMLLGLFLGIFTQNLWSTILFASFFAFGSGALRPLLISKISKEVSEEKQGSIMGVVNSLGSLARIIAPPVGGLILTYYAPPVLFAFAFFIFLSYAFLKGPESQLNVK